ncbi:MAG: hypothetical protein II836_01320 [Clostridia bacterium]|nr:hypothetical protein [Clostridia bacterium]
MLLGYRQNSDGICVEDSRSVLVRDCFVRTGDDCFEIKSRYGNCTIPIEDITFDNCNAWPDKARGIGIICETRRDMTDIHFINCSVGFASATWMEDLGALVVYADGQAQITDVEFRNIEIYRADKYPINVTVGDDATAQIDGLTFSNIRILFSNNKIRVCNRSKAGGTIDNVQFKNIYRKGTAATDSKSLGLSLSKVDESSIRVSRTAP